MILSPEFFGGFLDDIYKINNKFIINAKLIDFLNSVLKEDNTLLSSLKMKELI